MKSFKQFLEEAVRTTDRATKLATYIFARAKRKNPSRMMSPPVLKASTPEEGFTQKHFNVMMKLHKRKDDGEWQDVPIENIRTPQRYLDPKGIKKKIAGDDKDSGELRGLKVNGNIHIPDGNHRISAARLRGDKTVRIKVFD